MNYAGRKIHTNVDILGSEQRDTARFYVKSVVIATAAAGKREGSLPVAEDRRSTGFNDIATDAVKVIEERGMFQII